MQLDQAETHLLEAIRISPHNSNTVAQLARIYCRTGRIDAGIRTYHQAANMEPGNTNYVRQLVYWSNYSDLHDQQSSYKLARYWAKTAFPQNEKGSNTWRTANPNKKLKIAFVSADFMAHAVSFFIIPLLKNIDRSSYAICAYSDTKVHDGITEKVKQECDFWRDSSSLNDAQLSGQIAADEIDVLIDLSGHTANNRLGVFAKHIAPIQISWLGYPSTTGLDSIHYRITDQVADPIGIADPYFSEQLIRLRNGFLCYEPLDRAPEIKSDKINKNLRFGSFNNLAKISATSLDCWAEALHAVPNSTLYLKRQQLINESAKNHLIEEFEKRGISKTRLILKTSKAKIEKHLDEYNEIDIALDTYPYNGTTTTLEALWMGVPVVSLYGNTHASRVSKSILHRLNLDELAVNSIPEFAQAVQMLSKDSDLRSHIRNTLRQKMSESPLMNQQQFCNEFMGAIRKKWEGWCNKRNIEAGLESPKSVIGPRQ